MGNCFSYKYYDIKKDKNNKVIYEGSFKKKKKHGYGIEYKNQKKNMIINGLIIINSAVEHFLIIMKIYVILVNF
tara:strand:+ start:120 stop:341 length:222 start_codon:yes stop_codon:yes gene_type:complete